AAASDTVNSRQPWRASGKTRGSGLRKRRKDLRQPPPANPIPLDEGRSCRIRSARSRHATLARKRERIVISPWWYRGRTYVFAAIYFSGFFLGAAISVATHGR